MLPHNCLVPGSVSMALWEIILDGGAVDKMAVRKKKKTKDNAFIYASGT